MTPHIQHTGFKYGEQTAGPRADDGKVGLIVSGWRHIVCPALMLEFIQHSDLSQGREIDMKAKRNRHAGACVLTTVRLQKCYA
jgi:hypothetical protein